jgi:hypothetical protein
MLKHKPTFRYAGLTIILSNASRFDNIKLLSGGGGRLVDEFLQPEYNRWQCDIRLKEDASPILPETKCILLLGESAAQIWLKNADNTLGEIRGSVFYYDGRFSGQDLRIPTIASFFPQDASDIKNYEKEFNAQTSEEVDISEDENESEIGEKSRHGRTKRKNYRFWLQQDIKKCKHILKHGVPKRPIEPNYILAPKANELIRILTEAKNKEMFVDIESYYPACDIKCVAFSFDRESSIYSFPFFSHDYSHAYSDLHLLLRALAISFRDNIVIAHNGANFDFLIFAWKYRIPIGKRVKDTMVQQHRIFSDVEKSLGHCTSLWTWEPFHKDEGNVGYNTPQQMKQTLEYCGKDVFTMKLIYYAQLDYTKTVPGLQESFDQANSSIRPYLTCSLLGFAFKDEMRAELMNENDKLMMQYLRMLEILIGKETLKAVAGKSKKGMPNSNKQCVEYFHNLLGYAVVARGDITKTGARNPSLGKKALYKLRLKYDNPVIDICLIYRECAKETGSLKFIPWNINSLETQQQTNQQLQLV